eukprot:1730299-Amphidinium_carterae.1
MDGCPRSKTWQFATNCRPLLHSLSHASICTHAEHAPCPKCPYPAYFEAVVHQAVRSWVLSRVRMYSGGSSSWFVVSGISGRGPQVAKTGFEHKMLLQLLQSLASTSPLHTYSTIQFNHLQIGNQMSLHIDGWKVDASLHDPSKHSEGQYDVVSTYHRWVEVTKGDRYGFVLFTLENLHSRMSPESLDVLRQQGFPLNSQEFGLLANLDAEFHGNGKGNGSTPDRLKGTPNAVRGRRTMDTLTGGVILPDRCVQGGIQNVVVGVD